MDITGLNDLEVSSDFRTHKAHMKGRTINTIRELTGGIGNVDTITVDIEGNNSD